MRGMWEREAPSGLGIAPAVAHRIFKSFANLVASDDRAVFSSPKEVGHDRSRRLTIYIQCQFGKDRLKFLTSGDQSTGKIA